MSKLLDQKGSCMCGAVKVTAKELSSEVGVCHCGMCRKWAAGPFLVVEVGADASFEGEENITTFASSAWASRSFCKQCGTPLYYKLNSADGYYMSASLFDDEAGFSLTSQIFIDKKPGYYSFAEETQNMTGAELMASFQSQD